MARVLITAALVAGCSGTAPTPQIIYVTPPPTTAATAAAPPAQSAPSTTPAITAAPTVVSTGLPSVLSESHTEKGTGTKNSPPFKLSGGNYVATWTVKSAGPCFHGAFLQSPTDALVFESLGTVNLTKAGTVTDSTNLYGLKPGSYFFKVASGCDWTITVRSA